MNASSRGISRTLCVSLDLVVTKLFCDLKLISIPPVIFHVQQCLLGELLFSAITSEREGRRSKFGQKFMTAVSAFALALLLLGLDPPEFPIKLSVYATAGGVLHRYFQSSHGRTFFISMGSDTRTSFLNPT